MLKLRFDDTVKNMAIHAADGDIGECVDLLFDERFWTARYLVVKTGGWLLGRKVLIPITAVDRVDLEMNHIELCLTKEQIENAPGIDTDAPVSRRHEVSIMDYYAYGYYWGLGGAWGASADPMLLRTPLDNPQATIPPEQDGDPYLRSVVEILGYQISAHDDDIGTVRECYVCPPTWFIKYIEVETGSWLSKRRVLLTPEMASDVSWADKSVTCYLTRQDLERAPDFEPPLTESFEAAIDGYYDKIRQQRHASV